MQQMRLNRREIQRSAGLPQRGSRDLTVVRLRRVLFQAAFIDLETLMWILPTKPYATGYLPIFAMRFNIAP